MKKETYEIWKEGRDWKVQMPKGRLTFPSKKLAQEFVGDWTKTLNK